MLSRQRAVTTRRSSLGIKQTGSPDDMTSSHTLMTSLIAQSHRSTSSLHAAVRGKHFTCLPFLVVNITVKLTSFQFSNETFNLISVSNAQKAHEHSFNIVINLLLLLAGV